MRGRTTAREGRSPGFILALLFLLWLFCFARPCLAQWTNPNPTSAVSVAIMVSTGATGAVQGPKTVSGFTSVGSDRFVASELTLGGVLIDSWSDIGGASILNMAQYLTSAQSTTAPGAPYANIVNSGSAPAIYIARAKGVNGIIVTNDANGNVIVDGGNPTGTVDALFPPQTTDVTRFYYRSFTAPYNVTYVDLVRTTNGYLLFDGTNFLARTTVAVGTATNATLFASQDQNYYRDFLNQTNVQIWDDGALDTMDVVGFEAGASADWELVNRTNGGVTSVIARLNIAGGSNDLGRLNSSNAWTEFNSFEDDTYFFQRIIRTGNGITLGDGASVGTSSSNLSASGQQSTAAGGWNNSASGNGSTVGGGLYNGAGGLRSTAAGGYNNQASGSSASIGGGRENQAGDYCTIAGGDNIDLLGQYSSSPGGWNLTASKNYMLMYGRNATSTNQDGMMVAFGDVETNRLKSYQDRVVSYLWDGTNRGRLGINTANPTCEVQAASMMADSYYGTFKGDISQASGAPAASNSQFVMETLYGTNGQTRRLVFLGAAVTNVLVEGGTTTVYFANSLGGGGGSASLTSTWAAAVTLSTTNATMIPFGPSNTLMASTGTNGTPGFYTLAQLNLATGTPVYSTAGLATGTPIYTESGTGTLVQSSVQDVYVRVSGETNLVVLTGATVRVRTPSAGTDAANKSYVDSAASAAVTNAVDSATVNGTPYTGLHQINVIDPSLSSSQAGSTLTVTRASTYADYFNVTLSATGMAAWTPSAATWTTGIFDTVRSNDQGVWKTNSYAFVFTSTGLVFVTTHLQVYHAVDIRACYIYRNGVPYRSLSYYYTAVNNKDFDDGGTIIFENANATNIYSAVFFWETASGGSIAIDGSSNSLYIIGGRFQ